MFNLNNFTSVLNHLQNLSNLFFDKGSHYMMFCQYCNDATRKVNPTHGHLYVSKSLPVFHCFRCGASSTLIRLLIETGFDDEETLKQLGRFSKFKIQKDFFVEHSGIRKKQEIDIHNELLTDTQQFRKKYPYDYKYFCEYIYSRLGEIDINYFLLKPSKINFKDNIFTGISCYNTDGNYCTTRLIDNNNIRFTPMNNKYFFQEKIFENFNNIVITEGFIDLISIYLYGNISKQDTFFITANGKKFASTLEQLIFEELMIGSFDIFIIFDNDDTLKEARLKKCKNIASQFNSKIRVQGFVPVGSNANDANDHPHVVQLIV